MSNVTVEDREEPEYTWDYDTCEVCGDFATHRLYWGAELLHQYCNDCGNQKAMEMSRFWAEVAEVAAADAAKEAPL